MTGWGLYGIVFSLEKKAEEVLKQIDTGDRDTDLQILRAQILIDLSSALRAGLDREAEYANKMSKR